MSERLRKQRRQEIQPRWAKPETSTGKLLHSLNTRFGHNTLTGQTWCWEAAGLAQTTFDKEIKSLIWEYLEKYGDSASPKTEYVLFMVGNDPKKCHPTIFFMCEDKAARKANEKLVNQSGILKKYPGFRTLNCDFYPDRLENKPFMRPGPETDVEGDVERLQSNVVPSYNLYQDPSAATCGSKIYIKGHDVCSVATGGGIIQSWDKYYYLTVAHAFLDSSALPLRTTSKEVAEEFVFELDSEYWDDEFSEDMSLISTTSRGSISPEPDRYSSSDIAGSSTSTTPLPYSVPEDMHSSLLSQDSVVALTEGRSQPHDKPNETSGSNHISPTAEKIGSLYHYSVELDYALFELDCKRLETFNEIFPPGGSSIDTLVPLRVAQHDKNVDVIAATGLSGTLSGWLSATASYSIQPGTTDVQELWFVDLDGPLAVGDSGSWVVHAKTGDLVGQIVSGSPREGKALIVPAYKIFGDLELKTGQKFHLPRKPSAQTAGVGQRKTSDLINRDFQSPELNDPTGFRLMSSMPGDSKSSNISEAADESGPSLTAIDAARGGSRDGCLGHEHYKANFKRRRSKQDLAAIQDMQDPKKRRISRNVNCSAMDDLPKSEVVEQRLSIEAFDQQDVVQHAELGKSVDVIPGKESFAGKHLYTLRSSTLEDNRPSSQETPPPLNYIEDMMDFVYDNDDEYDEDDALSYIPAPQENQSVSVYVDTTLPHILIKKIPVNTSRQDMEAMCAGFPGFQQLAIRKRNHNPLCLIHFTDRPSAEAALPSLFYRLEQHLPGVGNTRLITSFLRIEIDWNAPEGSELTNREIQWPASPELSSSDGFTTNAYNPITDSTRSEDSITSIASTTSNTSCVTTSSANTEYSVSFSNTIYERVDVSAAAYAGAGVGAGVAGDRDARGHEDRM